MPLCMHGCCCLVLENVTSIIISQFRANRRCYAMACPPPPPPEKKQLHLCDHWNFIHSMTAKHCICIFTIVTLMFCTFCTATLYQFCTNFRLPQASLLRRCDNVWLSFINGDLRFVWLGTIQVLRHQRGGWVGSENGNS